LGSIKKKKEKNSKISKTHLSNLPFFHENRRFLDVSEIIITGGSLLLDFFPVSQKILQLVVLFVFRKNSQQLESPVIEKIK
jgi:hypothetical protein